ncbi:MAG: hypothetical protein AAB963_01115 [Patescibacteria group bacterium]
MDNGGVSYKVYKNDLIYPELSFEINGALFDVFNLIGGSHPEKTIQKAVAAVLEKKKLKFVIIKRIINHDFRNSEIRIVS